MSILFISQEEEITNINISRYRRIEYSDDNISVQFLNDGIINEYDHLITNEDGLDNNNGFIFSNVPKLITQNMKEKKIDKDGVKDFFNFGFPLNDRTLIKNG